MIPGDIIIAMDGKQIDSVGQFAALLDDYKIGDRVRLTLLRQGKSVDVSVTLQAER